jgi:hypothetical protein
VDGSRSRKAPARCQGWKIVRIQMISRRENLAARGERSKIRTLSFVGAHTRWRSKAFSILRAHTHSRCTRVHTSLDSRFTSSSPHKIHGFSPRSLPPRRRRTLGLGIGKARTGVLDYIVVALARSQLASDIIAFFSCHIHIHIYIYISPHCPSPSLASISPRFTPVPGPSTPSHINLSSASLAQRNRRPAAVIKSSAFSTPRVYLLKHVQYARISPVTLPRGARGRGRLRARFYDKS